jgi:parallel beta-helix repeat protein
LPLDTGACRNKLAAVAVITVTPAERWTGIADALARAVPGDTVRLAAGDYVGFDTFFVPSGLTLSGEPGARLVFEGSEFAVAVRDAEAVVLGPFALLAYRNFDQEIGSLADDPWDTHGIVDIRRSRNVTLAGLEVVSSIRRRNGISVVASQSVSVQSCVVEGGQRGIVFWSTTGMVDRCKVRDAFQGIFLSRDPDSPETPSQAQITGNDCHGNKSLGIVLISSISSEISGNRCWDNGAFGIALLRDSNSPYQPSRAPLTGNECHGNKEGGIVLSSSISSEISGNRCWNNGGSGISLQRDSISNDEPSQAPLKGNECYGNKGDGIVLSSSISSEISGNRCWDNESCGIGLQRYPNSPDQPSQAALTENECHGNKDHGIRLFSSISSAISSNRCWDNQMTGIAIRRDPNNPDQPSQAPITRNTSFNNGVGILLFSSVSEQVSQNICWRNSLAGIWLANGDQGTTNALVEDNRLQDNGSALICRGSSGIFRNNRHRQTGAPVRHEPSEGVEPARFFDNELDTSLNFPADDDDELTRALRTLLGKDAPDELAGEVASSLSCGSTRAVEGLRALAVQEGRVAERAPVPEPATALHDPVWRASWTAQGVRTVLPTRQGGGAQALARQLGRINAQAADHYESVVQWAALTAPDGGALRDCVTALEAVRTAAEAVEGTSGRFSAPVLVTMQPPGSQDADPFETAVLGPGGKWGQRLDCLLRTRLAWLGLATVGMALGLAAHFGWLTAVKAPTGWLDWLGLVAVLAAGYVSLIGLANLALPAALKIEDPLLVPLLDRLADANIMGRKDLTKALPTSWLARIRRKASVDWVRRRLFQRGAVVPLVVRHVEGWTDEQLLRLRQLDDRAFLREGVFVDSQHQLRPWTGGIDLHFDDGDDRVSLVWADSVEPGDFKALLGGRDEVFAQRVKGALLHPDWTALELPAVLPLGSAPTARFSIRRPVADAVEHDGPILRDMQAYAGLFGTEGAVQQSTTTLRAVFDTRLSFQGIGNTITSDEVDRRLWGKVGYRRQVGAVVRSLFADRPDCDAESYLASSTAAGLWRILGDVADAITTCATAHDSDEAGRAGMMAVRGLQAAGFLSQEIQALTAQGASMNGAPLEARWERVQRALEQPLLPGHGEAIARRWIAALHEAGRLPSTGPWSLDAILAEVKAAQPSRHEVLSPRLPRDALVSGLAVTLSEARQMDSQLATEVLRRLEKQDWWGLPEALLHGLRQQGTGTANQRLVGLLADATTLEALEQVVRLHARQPLRVVQALMILGSNACWPWNERRFDPRPVDPPVAALVKVAKMIRYTIASPELEADPVGRDILHDFLHLGLHTRNSAGVARLMETDNPADLLIRWLCLPPIVPPIDRVVDFELERLLSLAALGRSGRLQQR